MPKIGIGLTIATAISGAVEAVLFKIYENMVNTNWEDHTRNWEDIE